MRLLLLSPFFHPEAISTGRYNTVLARELVRQGAELEVIASHPLYPAWKPERSSDQLPGMKIHRAGAWLRYPRRPALRRMVLESWFAVHVALRLVFKRRRADRVVVVFPPNLLALALPMLLRGVQRIGIVHDLQGVLAQRSPLVRLVRWIERRALASCDRLVFLSHSMARRASTEYGIDPARITVHYPFMTLPQAVVDTSDTDVLASTLPDGAFHVVYSGALGDKQDPDRLCGLLRELARRDARLRCHVFSAGPHFDRLRAAAVATGDAGVSFHPLVPEQALGELYQRSSIQILPQAKGTGDGALPSKLPNLIAAGVPVFAISDPDSEAATLLEQAGPEAGLRVGEFAGEPVFNSFFTFLQRVRGESRAERMQRQRAFVDHAFGVDATARDILS
jgi:colanic acid biosynthesis glycosyl transferase WcaI